MESGRKIGVIGGGASGMMAAIAAAGCGARVVLFEKNDRVGKKLLATGNGKCNLSNLEFDLSQYYCKDKEKLKAVFQRFSVQDTLSLFEQMGLMIKNKNGYVYPYSEQASSVLDVLRMELERRQVEILTGAEAAEAIYRKESHDFQVISGLGKSRRFDRLILACGSPASLKKGEGAAGYKLARGFGHKIVPVVPGLVQLRSKDGFIKALAGVRCQAEIKLMVNGQEQAGETGELQFTPYGISGIPVFQLSRLAAYALKEGGRVKAVVNFFSELSEEAFSDFLRERYNTQKDKTLENYLTGTQNKKINMVMIMLSGLRPGMRAEEAGIEKIREMMQRYRAFVIHISDVNSIENAQICAGGVDFGQISAGMESVLVKGLYFAGEILDVDGKCGGYNLQWAWTSGYIAGRNAAGIPAGKRAKEKEGC